MRICYSRTESTIDRSALQLSLDCDGQDPQVTARKEIKEDSARVHLARSGDASPPPPFMLRRLRYDRGHLHPAFNGTRGKHTQCTHNRLQIDGRWNTQRNAHVQMSPFVRKLCFYFKLQIPSTQAGNGKTVGLKLCKGSEVCLVGFSHLINTNASQPFSM